jgi:hypothetical protein
MGLFGLWKPAHLIGVTLKVVRSVGPKFSPPCTFAEAAL